MSWFARSIANSLKFDEGDDGGVDPEKKSEFKRRDNTESKDDGDSSPTSPSRGVKEDFSELSRTLTRQFRGFASFLAPPPQTEQKADQDASGSETDPSLGIRGDFAEIGGRFRSGISRLSNNINVSEITKMASSFLQLESDDDYKDKGTTSSRNGPIGVTEEVVAFARDIAIHPETWLDFPLPEHEGDDDDFDMSEEQQEHALAVEQLAPRLGALRMELCPRYMSDDHFWKIYFVLVHTRLDKEDALLLSTPQVMEARALLANELKGRNTAKVYEPVESSHEKSVEVEEVAAAVDHEQEQSLSVPSNVGVALAVAASETPFVSRDDVVKDKTHNASEAEEEEDDVDDWLKEEETTEAISGSGSKSIPVQNDEEVSFSDLEEEEEEDGDTRTSYRKSNDSSDKESREWVQLGNTSSADAKLENANEHDTKESSDWLDVDDIISSS